MQEDKLNYSKGDFVTQTFDTLDDIIDTAAALDGLGGDREFFRELLGIFRAACPTLLHEIRDAFVKRDLYPVRRAAHLVKIAAQNIAARRVYLAALLLEKMAEYGELEDAREAGIRLEEEIDRLQVVLASVGHNIVGSHC